MFATGEIVGDYEPLYLYWREAGQRAAESVLSEKDFEELRRIVSEEGVTRLDEVIERLKPLFRSRVDPRAARRAISSYYGVEVDEETAVDKILGILAGWLVEAASEWHLVSLRRKWEKQEEAKNRGKDSESS